MKNTSWVEAITGVGIILSLIFVATEIRSNTRAVRGETMQGITSQSIDVSMEVVSNAELRRAFVKAQAGLTGDLTLEEEDILTAWYATVMRVAENRYRQRELGTFANTAAAGGGAISYRVPFFRIYWQTRGATYPADFRAYVDSTLLPMSGDSVARVIKR